MKKSILLLTIAMMVGIFVQAQNISQVSVSPLPVLDCNNTVVTVDGILNCINSTINGTSHSIVGNTIFVDVDITAQFICLGALSFFSLPEPLGNVPAGTYTLTTRTIVNGAIAQQQSQNLVVGTCCGTNGNFFASDDKFCPGESGTFTAADPNLPIFTWYVDGVVVGTGNQLTYTFNTPGSYDVSLYAYDGNCPDSTFQTVVVDTPSIQFGAVSDESCAGAGNGGAAVSINGGFGAPYVFSWSDGSSMQNLSQVSTGMYSLSVTDSEGCMTEDSIFVGLDTAVTVTLTSPVDQNYCAGDTLQLSHSNVGATSAQWLIDGQPFAPLDTSWVPMAGNAHVISVIATDGVCSDTAEVNAIIADSLSLTAAVTGESCAGTMDGVIDLTPNGGLGPFSFSWSHGPTTEDVSGLDTGMYMVQVRGTAGCNATESFQITTLGGITSGFSFTTSSDTVVAFADTSSPGVASWLWDFGDGSTSNMANPTHTYGSSGYYSVCLIATDSFGCTDTACASVEITRTTGIFDREAMVLSIVPNPATDRITLQNLPNNLPHTTCIVRDAMGRVVLRSPALRNGAISIQGLADGLYTVEVRAEVGVWRGKFLKR